MWREPQNNHGHCYVCRIDISNFSCKTKCHIAYPNLPTGIRPDDMLPPEFMIFVDNSDYENEDRDYVNLKDENYEG